MLETRLSVSNGGSWVKMTLPCTQGFRYEAENARKWLATDTDWMILATINSRLLICMRRSGKAAPGWSWRCGSRGCWDCEGGNWDGHLCIVFCRQSMAQALVVVLLVVFTSANPQISFRLQQFHSLAMLCFLFLGNFQSLSQIRDLRDRLTMELLFPLEVLFPSQNVLLHFLLHIKLCTKFCHRTMVDLLFFSRLCPKFLQLTLGFFKITCFWSKILSQTFTEFLLEPCILQSRIYSSLHFSTLMHLLTQAPILLVSQSKLVLQVIEFVFQRRVARPPFQLLIPGYQSSLSF